jgi:uncharacterized protein DUF4124
MGTRVAVLSLLAIGAVGWAASAAAQVYKCTQEGGHVLYSDVACKGGAIVDVLASAANPAAVRQLVRDNAAFDRKMDARRAAEDQAEFQRQQLNAQLEAARAAQGIAGVATDAAPYYYDAGYGFVAIPRHVKPRMRSHNAAPATQRVPAKPASPRDIKRQNR